MLIQRLFFGGLLILGLIVIFWGDWRISQEITSPSANLTCGSIIPLAILILTIAGTFEALNLARSAGYEPMGRTVLLGTFTLNALAWVIPAIYPHSGRSVFECQLITLVLTSMTVGVIQIVRHRTERGVGDVSVSIMILVYMGILPSFITTIRTSLPATVGVWAVLLFIAVVKGADIFAYFSGLGIGRTKLIPAISPGKTVEGFAGGMMGAILISVVLSNTLPWPQSLTSHPISWLQACLFGALMAGVGQLGDLLESVFKRDATSKDSGNVIPAFGGILDLLDSPIFAAPLGYLLLTSWLS